MERPPPLLTLSIICCFQLANADFAEPAPVTPGGPANPAPKPTNSAAMTLLLSGDAAAAARIMEEVVQAEPGKAENWRVLGTACLKANKLDRSLVAFQKLADLQPNKVPFLKLA